MLNFARKNMIDGIEIRHDWNMLSPSGKAWADVTKHGEHDQSTHGAWATGGAGVDITNQMTELFYDKNFLPKKEVIEKIDEMDRKDISAGRGYADNALEIIAQYQGFTGKPKTVETIKELQEFAKKNDSFIGYRGISNYSTVQHDYEADYTDADITYSAEQALKDFREGDYHAGWGSFGNGTYATTNLEEAVSYANVVEKENGKLGNGKTMAFAIPYSAKKPTTEVVKETMKELHYGGSRNHKNDIGRALAAKGYQYYEASAVQSNKSGIYVILDRSMLTVAVQAVEEQ
jgi:hypothetical protein